MSESPRPPLAARLPLISILAVAAFLELLVNRLLVRLLHLEPLALGSHFLRVLDVASLFVFELVSALSVLLLLAALIRISIVSHYRPGARLAFPLIGGVAVALAILGVLVRLPPQLVFHLHLSFLFLALLSVLTVISSPSGWRNKLGAFLILVALILRLQPAMLRRYSPLPGLLDGNTQELLNAAFFGVVVLVGLCLLPTDKRGIKLASLVTGLAVCGVAIFMQRDWEDASRVASYGFDIDLPMTLWGQVLALSALAFALNTCLRLLYIPGISRLRGWGLLLLALGGVSLSLPYQVALAALGLLCLAEAAARPDPRALTRGAFEQLVRQLAATMGAPRVTTTGSVGSEAVRMHAPPREGMPLSLQLRRHAGVIDDLELSVGEAPAKRPPLTVERRDAGGSGPRGEGEVVEIGDPAFDGAFVLRDRRDVGARLLDDATRTRLLDVMRGWLGVWPRAAVRYHARELPSDLDKLISLLLDLSRRAE